jgi:hypothetical protein
MLRLVVLLVPFASAGARTLSVGPNQPFPGPSAAANAAQDGDIVLIEPGEYYDCAVWTHNHLVIAGTGPGVVITDTACQGKALFVITGDDTTIRGLTLARARVPDGNGAGIRQEGQGLTLERVRFVNNEVGLLAGAAGAGAIRISDCGFEGGGVGGGDRATFAVLVDAVSLLRIEGSSFKGVKGGQINSLAARTELSGNRIGTGTGERPEVAVVSAGGHLVMEDNVLSIGPTAPRLAAAVLVTGQDAPRLRGNRLLNATGRSAVLLLDWSGSDPVLEGNQVGAGDVALSTSGLWRHRAAQLYHGTKDAGRAFAGRAKRRLLALVGIRA